jgi:hypothetical protein
MAEDLRTDNSHLMRVRGLVHRPPWTRSTAPWTYSTVFSEENNSINLEIRRSPRIFQKHPELFQNYVLVSKNLHIGPCINFYIYN